MQTDALALGVPLDDGQADRLIRYVGQLERWNARFNLISRRDIGRVWPRHILDSLSIAPLLGRDSTETTGMHVLDIGTGAGLPGLPLAIALPELTWRLIDRNQRKIRFLETVIGELGLTNVVARVADLNGSASDESAAGADIVVSRAVDDPAGLLRLADPLLKPDGRLVLMTSTVTRPEEDGDAVAETTSAPQKPPRGFEITGLHEIRIPGLDRTHEVMIIERERCEPGSNPEPKADPDTIVSDA